MRSSTGFMIAWVGATIVSVAVATVAVGSVRSNVTDSPTVLGSPAIEIVVGEEDTPSTTLVLLVDDELEGGTTTTVPMTTAPSTPVPTVTILTTTTMAGTPPPITTTTLPTTTATTTTTTTQPSASWTKTYDTAAGTVLIRIEGESVKLVNVRPNPGWTVHIEYDGPDEVEVRFEPNDEDDDSEVEFFAIFVNGELQVTILEE